MSLLPSNYKQNKNLTKTENKMSLQTNKYRKI